MKIREAKRMTRELTPEEQARLEKHRKAIAQELPDLIARDQMRKDARQEATLSGQLRRSIQADDRSLDEIARMVGITSLLLDEFLTGERTLRSDVLDRLAGALGMKLTPVA